MACRTADDLPAPGVDRQVQHGDEPPGREVLGQQPVQLGQHFGRTDASFRQRPQHASRCRHQQRRAGPFPRDVRQHQSPAPILERNEVVEVASDDLGREAAAQESEARHNGHGSRQQARLDVARDFQVAPELGLPGHLVVQQGGLDRQRGLVAEMTGITPLLLLDEVVAHLDPSRRLALFDELAKLGAQVWMTGADPAAFTGLGASGEIFDVDSGRIARRP